MSTSTHSHYANASDIPFVQHSYIGKGSVGVVDRVTSRDGQFGDRVFARKTIEIFNQPHQPRDRDDELRDIENEVRILRRVNHHHVVQLVATYICQNKYAIVMAPCAQQNLEQYFEAVATSEQPQKPHWFTCLINGLCYIHRLGIQHRDIKPTNILISNDRVLLADFGISTVGLTKTRTTEIDKPRARTVAYCSPEVEAGHTRGQEADIFSLGAVFLELICVQSSQEALAELRGRIQSQDGFQYGQHTLEVTRFIDKLLSGLRHVSNWQSEVLIVGRRMLNETAQGRPSAADVASWLMVAMPPSPCVCNPTHSLQDLNHRLKEAYGAGHRMTVDLLLQLGAALTDGEKLVAAAQGGFKDIVQGLLQKDSHLVDRQGAIQRASRGGSLEIVQLLLDDGVNVNEKDIDERTALIEASGKGHRDIVSFLLEHGADVNIAGPGKQTPLVSAAESGHVSIVSLLLLSQPYDLSVALGRAVENGHEVIVQRILEFNPGDRGSPTHVDSLVSTAAEYGHTSILCLFLERKVDVNRQNSEGSTALHKAMENGHQAIAELLLQNGVLFDVPNAAGESALHAAAAAGHDVLVQLLLDQKCNTGLRNKRGFTAMDTASEKGHAAVVQRILRHELFWTTGVWTAQQKFHADYRLQEEFRVARSMVIAAENRHEEVVRIFLKQGGQSCSEALLLAVKRENKIAVQIMLANDVGEGTEEVFTVSDRTQAFALAMKHGPFGSGSDCVSGDGVEAEDRRKEILALLFDHPTFTDDTGGGSRTSLHKAAAAGYVDLVKLLLDSGIGVNKTDSRGWTPFHEAAANNHESLFEVLVKGGALIDPVDAAGETPLHAAVGRGHMDASRNLWRLGASVRSKNDDGQTILHKIAKAGLERWVGPILDAGASVNSRDAKHRTPLHEASAEGHCDTVRTLARGGGDVNMADKAKVTALHMAARYGNKELVQELLERGAKVNQKDLGDETALHKAAENGHVEVADFLLKAGASKNVNNRGGKWVKKKTAKSRDDWLEAALVDSGLVQDPDDEGRETPLHKASRGGHIRVVGLLLHAGADAYAKNRKGQMAGDVVANTGVGRVFFGWAASKKRPFPGALSDTE